MGVVILFAKMAAIIFPILCTSHQGVENNPSSLEAGLSQWDFHKCDASRGLKGACTKVWPLFGCGCTPETDI